MRTALGTRGYFALTCTLLVTAACGSDSAPGAATRGDAGSGGASVGGKTGAGGSKGGTGGASSGGASAGGSTGSGGKADAGSGSGGTNVGDGGPDSGAPGGVVHFSVPAGGGQVPLTLANGHVLAFDFPASAAGKNITLTPTDATSIGWPAGQFDDVVKMTPDGLTFTDPVIVRPQDGSLLALDFPSSASKAAPDGLALNTAGDGLELRHFSTLAIVPPGKSCDSTSGWHPTANDQRCSSSGAATTAIDFACKGYSFCQIIQATCCALPGATECQLGDANLSITYTHSDGNGQYPYCVAPSSDSGTTPPASDAGTDAAATPVVDAGFVSTPTLTTLSPSTGAVAAVITASGVNWVAYFNQNPQVDFPIDAHFYQSSTEVFDPATPFSGPSVTRSAADPSQATFAVPNITAGVYDVAIRFRNGTLTNTLPFTIQ